MEEHFELHERAYAEVEDVLARLEKDLETMNLSIYPKARTLEEQRAVAAKCDALNEIKFSMASSKVKAEGKLPPERQPIYSKDFLPPTLVLVLGFLRRSRIIMN